MRDLRQLWQDGGLIKDTNGDGVCDALNLHVAGIREDCLPLGLLDFTARLGLETSALRFPLFEQDEAQWTLSFVLSPSLGEQARIQLQQEESMVRVTAGTERVLSAGLRWLAQHWPHHAEATLTEGLIETVNSITYTPQGIRINERHFLPLQATSVHQVERKRVQLSSLLDWFDHTGYYQNQTWDPAQANHFGIQFGSKPSADVLLAAAQLAARIGLESTHLAFPVTTENDWSEKSLLIRIEEEPADPSPGADDEGSLTLQHQGEQQVITFQGSSAQLVDMITYVSGGQLERLRSHLARQETSQTAERPLLFRKTWTDAGERQEVEQLVKGHLQRGASVICYLSEPASVRRELEQKWLAAGADDVKVRSSFKTGFFWLEEEVLPQMKKIRSAIGSVQIVCQTEQRDGLELPIRWLQELYPVDVLLARQLSLDTDDIRFALEEDVAHTYQVDVYGTDGALLQTHTLDVPITKLPYVDGKQSVYPTTSYIRIEQGTDPLLEQYVRTDRERFWLFYLEEVLPQLNANLSFGEGAGDIKPLFDSIRIEVTMSEEERKLGIDEERISSLEALHEDLYFNTLDYFAHQGEQTRGRAWNAPGAILPFMKQSVGAQPRATVEAYGWNEPPLAQRKAIQRLLFVFERDGMARSELSRITDGEGEVLWTADGPEALERSEELPEELRALLQLPGVHIERVAYSYEGRPIHVIEVTKSVEADVQSKRKLALAKPTILIETGHHANEVSSMPAIRQLIRQLVQDEPDVLNSINLVAIPCANPDGKALHEQLIQDHPEWKHHAARYNAVGLEYAHVRFQSSVFGEADVLPRLIETWLPDVLVDDHGIPSHEWVQPFAGFNSPPRFPNSFWIPNALIYGIAKRLNPEQAPQHEQILRQAIDRISAYVYAQEPLRQQNKYWLERYHKYGHQWLPDVFPVEDHRDMIFYQWTMEADPTSSNYIQRYPQWCSLDLISEAADETVYGQALERCVDAHIAFNLGLIHWLAGLPQQRIERLQSAQSIGYHRPRPLQIELSNG